MAAHAGHVAVVQLLLDAEAAVDAVTTDGLTPLQMASCGHTTVVQLLSEAQAVMNDASGEDSSTALHKTANKRRMLTKCTIQ